MKVVVVGAGFAGLRAAMLFERKGFEVVVFEARDRIGGRSFTVREGALCYDAGGEWLDADHYRVRNLADELGLGLIKTEDKPRDVCYRGEWRTTADLWPEAVTDSTRFASALRQLSKVISDPTSVQFRAFDDIQLSEILDRSALSEVGSWWLKANLRSDEGEEAGRLGLLGFLLGQELYSDREEGAMSAFRVQGGMSSIPEAMASKVKGPIRVGLPVTKIEQTGAGVWVDKEVADAVIVTCPPPAVLNIVFEPNLNKKKLAALGACQMSRTIKICWTFAEPWWLATPSGGSFHVDSPLQQIWGSSIGQSHVLLAYVCGDQTKIWTTKKTDPTEELRKLFPDMPNPLSCNLHDWISDCYAGGGFSAIAPGFVFEHQPHIATSEGRIFFAGEHTATWTGFFEGALESAERVAEEVIKCLS